MYFANFNRLDFPRKFLCQIEITYPLFFYTWGCTYVWIVLKNMRSEYLLFLLKKDVIKKVINIFAKNSFHKKIGEGKFAIFNFQYWFSVTWHFHQMFENGWDRHRLTPNNGRMKNYFWCCKQCSWNWKYLKNSVSRWPLWEIFSMRYTIIIMRYLSTTSGIVFALHRWWVQLLN